MLLVHFKCLNDQRDTLAQIDSYISIIDKSAKRYWKAWSATMYALNLLRGAHEERFQRLSLYCYNMEKKNLGIITHIKTRYENKFGYFFMAIDYMLLGSRILNLFTSYYYHLRSTP
uniref:Uncharacterized protein n=1 Tax=Lactuca sativa TaxID=4236 RepID=A0A9R1X9W8_LACSA|nr:hypothetical protein LSAT_V11C600337940 [Lactuca sativa]